MKNGAWPPTSTATEAGELAKTSPLDWIVDGE